VPQDQQAQHYLGGEPRPAATATVGMALCQSLVNRSDDFVIREYCVDVRHPCLTQILDFCRDQSIAEAALQALCLDHASRLRTAPIYRRSCIQGYTTVSRRC
jgi:hypothetical protein